MSINVITCSKLALDVSLSARGIFLLYMELYALGLDFIRRELYSAFNLALSIPTVRPIVHDDYFPLFICARARILVLPLLRTRICAVIQYFIYFYGCFASMFIYILFSSSFPFI